jgi:hypothetical protein
MQQCKYNCFNNCDTNYSLHHSVWKFQVVNCNEILRKSICFKLGVGGREGDRISSCPGYHLSLLVVIVQAGSNDVYGNNAKLAFNTDCKFL